MFKKEKYALLIFAMLVALQVQGAEQGLVTVVSPEECARRLHPYYQYLVRNRFLNELQEQKWTVADLRKRLEPACLRYFMYWGIKECRVANWWVPVEGGLSTCLITQSLRELMDERAEKEVAEFFRQHPDVTFQTILTSDLWSSLPAKDHWSSPYYHVYESDFDRLVEDVIQAIIIPEPEDPVR